MAICASEEENELKFQVCLFLCVTCISALSLPSLIDPPSLCPSHLPSLILSIQGLPSIKDGTSHLTVHQTLGRLNCCKACWSRPKPANDSARQPSLSATIWLMNCQSLSRGRPGPKPRGNQSLLVWTLNYSPLLKSWAPSDSLAGEQAFCLELVPCPCGKGEDYGIKLWLETSLLGLSLVYTNLPLKTL